MNLPPKIDESKTTTAPIGLASLRPEVVNIVREIATEKSITVGTALHFLADPKRSGVPLSENGGADGKITLVEFCAGLESYLESRGVSAGGDDNPNSISVLTAPPGQHQSKDWTQLDEKRKPKPAASNVVSWLAHGVPLPEDLDTRAAIVADLAGNPLNVLAYGRLRDDVTPRTGWHDRIVDPNSERVKAGTGVVTFQDVPRALLVADIDTPVTDPLEMQLHLPKWARNTNHVLVLSGSCGFPGGKPGIRGRAIIRLDRAVSAADLRVLCAGSGVDEQPLTAVGLHYIAAPITSGNKDPYAGNRVFVVRQPGWCDAATLPVLSTEGPVGVVRSASPTVIPGTAQNGAGLVMTPAGAVPADAVYADNHGKSISLRPTPSNSSNPCPHRSSKKP